MIFKLFRSVKRLDDSELISLYKQRGELKYVAELYDRYSQLISGLCLKYLKHVQNAEDAAMDVFEIICKDLKKHEVRNPNNWLYSVTRYHCLKLLKKQKNIVHPEDMEKSLRENFMESSEDDTLLEKQILEKQLSELKNALNLLKEEQRRCVELFYLKKLSYEEVSSATGYDIKKVKSHIQNGKRNLKIKLKDRLERK